MQGPADQVDQAVEPYSFPAPDVEHSGFSAIGGRRLTGPLQGRQRAVDYVRYESIVPFGRSVPEHLDRLTPGDGPGEPVNREIGTLPGPVDREVPYAGDPHPVQVGEGPGHQLRPPLARRVR